MHPAPGCWRPGGGRRTHGGMDAALPLDFSTLPLGSLYEERLVEDLLLLVDVVSACQAGDDGRLAELGVWSRGPALLTQA